MLTCGYGETAAMNLNDLHAQPWRQAQGIQAHGVQTHGIQDALAAAFHGTPSPRLREKSRAREQLPWRRRIA